MMSDSFYHTLREARIAEATGGEGRASESSHVIGLKSKPLGPTIVPEC